MVTSTTSKKVTTKRSKAKAIDTSHPLSHRIPDMYYFDKYISRTIGGHKDLDLLKYARADKANTMLFGPTGPGKSSMIVAYCAKERIPLVTIQANGGVDPNSFWGQIVVDMETGKIKGWQDSEVLLAIKHGGFIYIDEVNYMPGKVNGAFNSLLDFRRQVSVMELGNQVFDCHEEAQFGISFNPGYEDTRPLSKAYRNRFKMKLRIDYDLEVEKKLVYIPEMLEVAAKLRLSVKSGDLDTPVSTNMLIEFEELSVDLGYPLALEVFLNAFDDDERSAVRDVMELHSTTIQEQLEEMERIAASQS